MQVRHNKDMHYLSCFYTSISFIAQNARGIFFFEILFFTISGLLPALNVAAISLIISGAENLRRGMTLSQSTLLTGLVLLGVSLFTQRMILLGQMPLSSVFQYRIKNRIDRLVVEKTVSLPYASIEDPAFQTKLESVRRFSNNLPNLLFHTLSVFQAILSLVFLLVQFQGQIWLILPLALGQLPGLFISLHNRRKQHDLEMRQMDGKRRQDYYLRLSTGMQYVKEKMLFRLDKLFSSRWSEQNANLNQEQLQLMGSQIGLKLIGDTAALAAFLFCVVMILMFPATDAARFVSLTSALFLIQSAFAGLISSWSGLRGQLMDDQVVFEFLKFQVISDQPKELMNELIKTVAFENVTFSYDGTSKPALKNVNVELHSGETIAIVGENGAGKTTFIKLLLGLYQPDSGRVLCNGRDVQSFDRSSYFKHISAILQAYNHYPLTAAQNIDLFAGEGEQPAQRIIAAARQSKADTYIEKLPQGYQTLLTHIRENGTELSGGQWQRMAIARGICKPAELFIMDEPTSAVDPLLETEILEQFLRHNSSVADSLKIIVSHRVGIASEADRILAFKDGCLEEIGTHEELMRKKGYYAKLYSAQAKWYKKGEEEII